MERLKCPECGIPTIENKQADLKAEEYTCDKCYAQAERGAVSHTPGPWKVVPGRADVEIGNGYYMMYRGASGLGFSEERWKTEEALSNARLIAAAPEMLEALKIAHKEIRAWRDGLNHRNMNKAKVGATYVDETVITDTIAKAEGR